MMAMKMIYYKNDDINDDGHADRDNLLIIMTTTIIMMTITIQNNKECPH